MVNKILTTFIAADGLFALGGGLILAVVLITQSTIRAGENLQNVAQILLLSQCPLTGTSCSFPIQRRVPAFAGR
jgi:hypothetical protein